MKICLLSYKGNFDNQLGQGTQRYAYQLWHHLSKNKNVNVIKKEMGSGKITFTLAVNFPFVGYDIIHLPSPIMFAPPLKGKSKIVTTATEFMVLSNDAPMRIAEREAATKRKFMDGFITRSCINQIMNSDYILAISSLVKQEAIKKGFNPENIFITNLGIDERFSQPIPEKENKKFVVGYLGALNIRKNVKFAIEAFKKVEGKEIEFHIWGKGNQLENLKQLAKDDKRIKFMGFAPEEKLIAIYDSFNVFVYPILYTGFELEILEAQARGIPVIIYKKATIPDEVRKYCIEADNPENMAILINRIKISGWLSKEQGMAYARSFTWEKCVDDTIKAYQAIMECKYPPNKLGGFKGNQDI